MCICRLRCTVFIRNGFKHISRAQFLIAYTHLCLKTLLRCKCKSASFLPQSIYTPSIHSCIATKRWGWLGWKRKGGGGGRRGTIWRRQHDTARVNVSELKRQKWKKIKWVRCMGKLYTLKLKRVRFGMTHHMHRAICTRRTHTTYI